MGVLLLIAAAVVAVPLLGLGLALIQLGTYRALANLGRIPATAVPWFGILWLRGMAGAVAVLALLAIASRVAGGPAPAGGGATTAAVRAG